MRLLLMFALAVLPSASLKFKAVKVGQTLARLKSPTTGGYEVCWSVKKQAGAWSATLRHLARNSPEDAKRTVIEAWAIKGAWTQGSGCFPVQLTTGDVLVLRADAVVAGTVTAELKLRGDAAP